MKINIITISMVSLLGLSACNNSSSNNDNPAQTNVESYSSQNPGSKSLTIADADMLKSDLNTLFGEADGEPKAVEDGDSIQDVINR